MSLIIRPAEPLDAHLLARRLRPADAMEFAANGREPYDGLMRAYGLSDATFALVDSGCRTQGLFGFASIDDDTACPWLVGSEALVTTHRAWFLRNSARIAAFGDDRWTRFHNYVHAGNTLHIRWLRWVGFQVGDPTPLGPREELFHPIFRNAPCATLPLR